MKHRTLAALLITVVAGAFLVTTASAQSTDDVGIQAFEQRWSANPATEGLNAFVGIEDDRSDSHPAGQPHITAEGDQYRFVMHRVDRDGSDRQRNEVRAIREGSTRVDMRRGETWRYNYQMYMPSSLKSTTSFTHIFQMKHTGVGNPVVTLSLFRSGSSERIELRLFEEGQYKLGQIDVTPLRNKWVDVEIEIKVDDGDNGAARYSLRSGGIEYVNASRTGIDMWSGDDQAHPKWGIYRSISDTAQIQDTYLLLRNMRAYKLVDGGSGGSSYEAEASGNTRSGSVATGSCANCSGDSKIRFIGGNSSNWLRFNGVNATSSGSRQLTVYGTVSGTRTFYVSVNGGAAQQVSLTGTAWDTPVSASLTVPLNSGSNTIRFYNDGAYAPDLDRITIQ